MFANNSINTFWIWIGEYFWINCFVISIYFVGDSEIYTYKFHTLFVVVFYFLSEPSFVSVQYVYTFRVRDTNSV